MTRGRTITLERLQDLERALREAQREVEYTRRELRQRMRENPAAPALLTETEIGILQLCADELDDAFGEALSSGPSPDGRQLELVK